MDTPSGVSRIRILSEAGGAGLIEAASNCRMSPWARDFAAGVWAQTMSVAAQRTSTAGVGTNTDADLGCADSNDSDYATPLEEFVQGNRLAASLPAR